LFVLFIIYTETMSLSCTCWRWQSLHFLHFLSGNINFQKTDAVCCSA